MERLVASSDMWPDITATVGDQERTYPIGLELTYGFDPKTRQMAVAICGLRPGADESDRLAWREVALMTGDANVVYVFASNLATAHKLVAEMGLPSALAPRVREHLDQMARSLDSFVKDAFLGRTVPPDPPQPTGAQSSTTVASAEGANNILITVDRDVSKIFGRKEGSLILEYTLFSEPKVFRAVIMARRDEKTKRAEFIKKDVQSVIDHLNSDNLAHEVASFFGDTDSHKVYLIGAVLKLGFGMNTGLAKETAARKMTPVSTQQETVTLPRIEPVRPPATMFSEGEYRQIPG